VEAIEATVERLTAAGIQFLRYPGLNDSNPLGIWTSPSGARIAWFHDPDGNVLSLTQF
jgi:predicted enzyme related to lactoylglutathione lyase